MGFSGLRASGLTLQRFGVVALGLLAGCSGPPGQAEGPARLEVATTARASVADGRCTAQAIATGDRHSCILRGDGTVRCWGSNTFFQLGITPAATVQYSPVMVPGLSGVVGLSAGASHTCALLADTTVSCWGRNNSGQLGDGTLVNRAAPAAVSGLVDVVQLASGSMHTCALKRDGTIWCWGNNGSGRLGDGTTTRRTTPVQVSTATGMINATAVAAGNSHTCALVNDGQLAFCWGANSFGQLGDSTRTARRTPVQVNSEDQWRSISAGQNFTCGVHQLVSNSVECWGRNNVGQLGDETTELFRLTPSPVHDTGGADLIDGVQLSAYGSAACVVLGDGTARCWGKNNQGQVGDGTTATARRIATPVSAPAGLANQLFFVSRGLDHACALNPGGELYCWGHNGFAQLGDGTRTRRTTPVRAGSQTGVTFAPFATEDDHALGGGASAEAHALAGDGADTLWAAGLEQLPQSSWVVRRTDDLGATWSTRSTFVYDPLATELGEPHLVRRFDGTLFLSGTVRDAGGLLRWLARRSIDSGDSWSSVDDFVLREGQDSGASGAIADGSGGIYVAGHGADAAGVRRWLVRGTADSGDTWFEADNYVPAGAVGAAAVAGVDGGGLGQFVVGDVELEGGTTEALVRRASLYWTSWSDVDTYRHRTGYETRAVGVAIDLAGRIFTAVSGGSGEGSHWIVRRSSDGGDTWVTVDDFQLEPGMSAEPAGVFIDRAGAVQVVGRASTASGDRGVLRTSHDHGETWIISDVFDDGGAATAYRAIAQDGQSGLHLAGASADRWVSRSRTCSCAASGTCASASGICASSPDGTACDDGDACTQADVCAGSECLGSSPVVCVAQDACHVAGVCSPSSGYCTNPEAPDGTPCDDSDLCTTMDACLSGSCTGTTSSCDDSDPCTVDTCVPATGCAHTNICPSGPILELDASLADGSAPYPTGCGAGSTSWIDLTGGLRHALQYNFASCGATSGWNGAGVSSDPSRLSFDGADDFTMTPADNLLDAHDVGALSAWIRGRPGADCAMASYSTTSIGGANMVWSFDASGGLHQEWNFNHASNFDGAWAGINTAPTSVNDGGWHHLVFSADGSSRARIFLDGAELSTSFLSTTDPSRGFAQETDWTADVRQVGSWNHHLTVGGFNRSIFSGSCNGDLAWFAVYDRALTEGEVAGLCNAMQARFDGAACAAVP